MKAVDYNELIALAAAVFFYGASSTGFLLAVEWTP